MNLRWITKGIAVGILTCGVTSAHGPQIQITGDTGKIVTREIRLDEPYSSQLTAPKSVYVIPVRQYNGIWYTRPNNTPDPIDPQLPLYYSGPGAAYGYDQVGGGPQVFVTGSRLSVQFTTGLTKWDGNGFVDAGLTELEGFRGANTIRTVEGGSSGNLFFPEAGISANYGSEGAGVHSTIRYRFLGDGASTAVAPADGVYLATLRFHSDDPNMNSSDPWQMVLYKNVPLSDALNAVASLGVDPAFVQVVPEPTVLVTGLGLMTLVGLRRRRTLAWT